MNYEAFYTSLALERAEAVESTSGHRHDCLMASQLWPCVDLKAWKRLGSICVQYQRHNTAALLKEKEIFRSTKGNLDILPFVAHTAQPDRPSKADKAVRPEAKTM